MSEQPVVLRFRRLRAEALAPAYMTDGAAGLDLAPWSVERQQFGVDVQLAHPACDQLGVLAAEVENDDGVGLAAAGLTAGDSPAGTIERAIRRRRLQGGLEINLHFGVVGDEHPMSGVGRLAMDCLSWTIGH